MSVQSVVPQEPVPAARPVIRPRFVHVKSGDATVALCVSRIESIADLKGECLRVTMTSGDCFQLTEDMTYARFLRLIGEPLMPAEDAKEVELSSTMKSALGIPEGQSVKAVLVIPSPM